MPDLVGDPLQIIRVGKIATVDLAGATCTVEVGDPDFGGFTTDEIQWLAQRAGETIAWSPPSVDEQVLLLCPDGDIAQAVALCGLYSAAFPAPGETLREFTRYADGAEFGYDPEAHHADITLPPGGTITITANGGITHNGAAGVTINAAAGFTLNADGGATFNADGGATINAASGGLDVDGDQRNTGMIDAMKEITSQIDVWFRRVLSLRRHTHSAASQPWDGEIAPPPPPEDPPEEPGP